MDETKKYHTYILRRPDKLYNCKPIPFYVGKGCGDRAYKSASHCMTNCSSNSYKSNIIKNLLRENRKVLIEFVLENVSNEEAIEKEKELIKKYGRKIDNSGILANITLGGEGMFGCIGELNTMYKKKHSTSTKKKISMAKSGKNHPNYGKQLSIETRKKISSGHKGKKFGDQTRLKMADSQRKFKLNKEELIKELKHFTTSEITKKYNISVCTLYKAKKRFNISKKFNLTRDELIGELEYLSQIEIAEKYKVSNKAVYNLKKKFNIPRRFDLTKDKLIKELSYLSQDEIAKKHNVNRKTIYNAKKRFNIK
jgi:predicted transcriptional regulator